MYSMGKAPQRAVRKLFISRGLLWHKAEAKGHSGNQLLHCTKVHLEGMKPFEPDQCSAVASSDPDSETDEDRASKPSLKAKIDEAEKRLTQNEVREKRIEPCVLECDSLPSQLC